MTEFTNQQINEITDSIREAIIAAIKRDVDALEKSYRNAMAILLSDPSIRKDKK
jgi:hypothetical protein